MTDNKLKLKIAQASLNQTALDWARNITNIYTAIDKAVEEGSDILALEELALTGYEANDEFQRIDNDRITEALCDIARYAKELNPNLVISIGHPYRLQMREEVEKKLTNSFEKVKAPLYDRENLPFNVQTIISGGRIRGMTAKTYLFNYERGYEKRYFNEWNMDLAEKLGGKFGTIQITITDDTGEQYSIPFGHPVINIGNGEDNFNLAQIICEEKWVASEYDEIAIDDGAYDKFNLIPTTAKYVGDKEGLVFLIANASPPAANKIDKHMKLNNLASTYADAVIDTDGLGSSGSTFAQFGHKFIAQDGKTLFQGKRMSFNRVDTMTNVIEINKAPKRTIEKAHAKIAHEFTNHDMTENNIIENWDNPNNPDRIYEETIRDTALWLFDYMRKTGAKGIAEALSGGADSAFNTTIVAVMVNMGVKELGMEQFCKELGITPKESTEELLKEFITAVYMGTDNSSYETFHAAEFLINGDAGTKGIGGKFLNRPVNGLMEFYSNLNDPLNPITPKDGVTYENIQARGRQVLIMAIANREGKMAIANPNLDEARNAYATFGGDLHSGTINLNAHLNKAFQLDIMRYMYEHGVEGIMPPIKALAPVLNNQPTAELLPPEYHQTDESALQRNFHQMDAISNYMLYARVKTTQGLRRLNAAEVFQSCKNDKYFNGVEDNKIYNMVRTSYYRWGVSQHKIHSSPIAPTFGRSVDHQTSQRTPNLNGGSRDELAQLGINLLFSWAKNDGLDWTAEEYKMLNRRAWQDEEFLKEFDKKVYVNYDGQNYDLKNLYGDLKEKGWKGTFKSLNNKHPLQHTLAR